MNDLAIIMPVYNESEIIEEVLLQWKNYLDKLVINYKIHVYNDGSKDNTQTILNKVKKLYPRIAVYHETNKGHGPTILAAYKQNVKANWIFQVDSDNEISPDSFQVLWENRNDFDFLIGKRDNRTSPVARKLISFISRTVVKLCYGKGVADVNSPYRLMRSSILKEHLKKIPEDTFAPNVIITGIVNFYKLRTFETKVEHRNRQTGEVSINNYKLLKAAIKSFNQTILFRFKISRKTKIYSNNKTLSSLKSKCNN